MMLEMIKEDIEKDIAKAKKQEEEAQAAYDKLVEDIEAAIKAKEQTKSDLEGEMASDSEARTQENTTMADNQGQLKAVMDYLKEIAHAGEHHDGRQPGSAESGDGLPQGDRAGLRFHRHELQHSPHEPPDGGRRPQEGQVHPSGGGVLSALQYGIFAVPQASL